MRVSKLQPSPDFSPTKAAQHCAPSEASGMRFCSIDDMQSAAENEGWAIKYRQLQAGSLLAHTLTAKCGDLCLMDEYVSRNTEAVGMSPEEYVTIMTPVGDTPFWVNGQEFDRNSIYLQPANSEMHALAYANVRVFSTHVPVRMLSNSSLQPNATWRALLDGRSMLLRLDTVSGDYLRHLCRVAFHGQRSSLELSDLSTRLVSHLNKAVHRSTSAECNSRQYPQKDSFRIIKQAREFIDAHLNERIRITEVCTHVATSLSTLERTFKRELRLSPSQYILARRLVAVNRKLRKARPGDLVAPIAMDFGFNHLGRFSAAYCKYFGELPSQTLRAR